MMAEELQSPDYSQDPPTCSQQHKAWIVAGCTIACLLLIGAGILAAIGGGHG
jgi:hypothetical protein